MRLVFLGPPGAGKGTQAALIAREQGWAHIASGDLFRQAVERGDELGQKVASYMEKGALVPDEIAIALILHTLRSLGQGFILDGFPRTLPQAQALDKALQGEGRALERAVYFRVTLPELVRRLSQRWTCRRCQTPYNQPFPGQRCPRCGGELYQRPDDREEVVRHRLEVYMMQTAPLLEYYREQGRLVEVDGEAGVEVVVGELRRTLGLKDEYRAKIP